MSDAGWALQKAMFDALSADAALNSILGAPPRLYDSAPKAAPFPYVVFGDARATSIAGADGLVEHDIRLNIHSRYDGRREVKDVITAILSALDGAALTLAGFALVNLRATFTDIIHRQEADAFIGVIRFRAVTERL
jgi:hypothetical protein